MARVGILILFLTLEEKRLVFTIEYDVNCAFAINNLIYVELYPLYNMENCKETLFHCYSPSAAPQAALQQNNFLSHY